MAQTRLKSGNLHMVGGDNGSDGNVLKSKGDGTMEWGAAVTPPTFSSLDYPGNDTALDPAGGQSLVVNGGNFVAGISVSIGGTTASSVTLNSASQITITTPAKSAGTFSLVLTNTNGGTATASNAVSYNGIPAFTNAAGSLGSVLKGTSISFSVAAAEPDGGAITYAITSGALPSGVSLNTSTGAITGTAPNVSAITTSNFTVTATDNENQSTARAYSITITVPLPSDDFKIVTYTGNSTSDNSGTTQNITGVGFKPDFVWIKRRDGAEAHFNFDSTRGPTKTLYPSSTDQEFTETNSLTSFDNDGFTVSGYNGTNNNGETFVAYCWKLNGGTTSSNTDGTNIDSTVQVNAAAGFSIVKFTTPSTFSSSNTVGHGLGSTPDAIFVKRTDGTEDWYVYHQAAGLNKASRLNSTINYATATYLFGTVNSTVFNPNYTSTTSLDNIAYCFKSIEGYSKFGSYTGNGTIQVVETGFKPAWILIKSTVGNDNWRMYDTARGITAGGFLKADSTDGENTADAPNFTILSSGFEITAGGTTVGNNANGNLYTYYAFAEDPNTTTPTLADSFNTAVYTGTGASNRAVTGVGFKPGLLWLKSRSQQDNNYIQNSLLGASRRMYANTTSTLYAPDTSRVTSFDSDGFTVGNNNSTNMNTETYAAWMWKGADVPSINEDGSIDSIVSANANAGFSIVKYIGGGGVATIGHGLSAAPEMVIVKSLGHSASWYTYHAGLDGSSPEDYNVRLNEDAARQDSASYWNDTAPTNSVFTIGTTTGVSQNNTEFIAYCFHSVTGYSKIGSYTGATAGVTITTGFQPDFVMIKSASNVEHWAILDSTRGSQKVLYPNRDTAESNTALHTITFSSTGFSFPHQNTADAMLNENGYTYIYAAFKIN
jgi:hypothetical protein